MRLSILYVTTAREELRQASCQAPGLPPFASAETAATLSFRSLLPELGVKPSIDRPQSFYGASKVCTFPSPAGPADREWTAAISFPLDSSRMDGANL